MSHLRSSLRWIGALIERKLGVCPYCMRASALGSIVGWVLYAAARLLWPSPVVHLLLAFAASAFTLLISAHLVAYMVRYALRLRANDRFHRAADPQGAQSLDRRQFLSLVLRAGAYALTIAVFPSGGLFAQAGNTCADMRATGDKGDHDVTGDADSNFTEPAAENTWGNPLSAVQAAAIAKAKAKCQAVCQGRSCGGNPPTCLPSAPAIYAIDCFPQNPNDPPGAGWKCKVTVKQCPCRCYSCVEQKPPPGQGAGDAAGDVGYGEGTGGSEVPNMQGNAATKCQDFCAQIKCAIQTKTCKSNGKTLGKAKPGDTHKPAPLDKYSRADIQKCKCICQ